MTIKAKSVEVLNVFLEVEPIPFNRGFYSVDMTFYFLVNLAAYYTPISAADTVSGIAFFSKKVILYGSEGNVKVFSSEIPYNGVLPASDNPRAVVQVVSPIVLNSRLMEVAEEPVPMEINLPGPIVDTIGGKVLPSGSRRVLVTLGLFTIVQLERKVQMLVPAYDFCIPGKECVTTTDDPCEVFKHIKFPTSEFFPPRLDETESGTSCNCSVN